MENENNEGGENGGSKDLSGINEKLDSSISAIQEQIKEMSAGWQQSVNQLTDTIVQSKKPVVNEEPEDLDNLSAADFEKRIIDKVGAVIEKTTTEKVSSQQRLNTTLVSLTKDFPEMQDSSSDFAKSMVTNHDALPAHLKNTPEGYEMAALKSSTQLGVLPVSKRQKATDEDFSLGGSGTGNQDKGAKKKAKLDQKTIELAALMGLDTSDKKVMENLTETAQREHWGRYR